MQVMSLSQLLKKQMPTLVETNEMERKGIGFVLDIVVSRLNYHIHIFLCCPVDRCVFHMCHSETSGCRAFNTEFLEKWKNSVALEHLLCQKNVTNIF